MLSAKTQPTVSRWIKPFHFPYLRPPPLNSSTHPKGAWVEVKRSRPALSRNITLTGAPLKRWHVNIMYLSDSNLQNTFCPASDVYPSVFCQFSSFLNLDLQYLRTGSSIWNVALRTDRTPFPYGFQWKKKIFILFLLLPYVQGLRMWFLWLNLTVRSVEAHHIVHVLSHIWQCIFPFFDVGGSCT